MNLSRRGFLKASAGVAAVAPLLLLPTTLLGKSTQELAEKPILEQPDVRFLSDRLTVDDGKLSDRQLVESQWLIDDIFEKVLIYDGEIPEFLLHFFQPNSTEDVVGYTIDDKPYRVVDSDYINIPMLSEKTVVKYENPKDNETALKIAINTHKQKIQDRAIQLILTAGVDRNIVVIDTDAGGYKMSKSLVSLMKVVMRRNGSGNSSSIHRGKMTDLILPDDFKEELVNELVDNMNEEQQKLLNVAQSSDGDITKLCGVNLHYLDELNEGEQYLDFYTNQLGGTFPKIKNYCGLVIGLDLSSRDRFVLPIKNGGEMTAHNESWEKDIVITSRYGLGVLDNRKILLGAV